MVLLYEDPASNEQAQRDAKICVLITVHIVFPLGYVPFQSPSSVSRCFMLIQVVGVPFQRKKPGRAV